MRIPNPCHCCGRFFKEFKEYVSYLFVFSFNDLFSFQNSFSLRGNVLDLAIGVIIGTAFTSLVLSFVEDIITPPFGLLLGGVDFNNLTIEMNNFIYTDKPPVVIRYGKFLQQLIDLLITVFVLFFVIKSINRVQELAAKRRSEEEKQAKAELSDEGKILLQMRDILLAQRPVVVIQEYIL